MYFICALEKSYDRLEDAKILGDRLNILMVHFFVIMETLNEKKVALIKAYPNRAKKFLDRVASRPLVNPSQYTFQKRFG